MITIPNQEKKFIQNNQSNLLGNIWSSFNLDLSSNLGRLRISPRLLANTTTADNSSLTTAPCAFRKFSIDSGSLYYFWTISGTRVHGSGIDVSSTFALDTASGTPTDLDVRYSDMELAFSRLYVSGGSSNKLYRLDSAGTWTNFTVTGVTVNRPHMLCAFGTKIYFSDANDIYPIDSANSISTKVSIGTSGDETNWITWMRSSSDRIWVGTLNIKGGKGKVYEWDGASTTMTRSYTLEAQGALACVIKDDVPWIIDSNGRLMALSGGSFKEVSRLPVTKVFLDNATQKSNNRFIHPNGATLIENRVNILVANQNRDASSTINENLPSGIWEYDERVGFYHKNAITYCDDDSGTVTDYGQNRVAVTSGNTAASVGALAETKSFPETVATANGTMMAGVRYYTDASTTSAGVFIDDTLDTTQKAGYFVTTWIDSPNVKEIWQKLFVTYRQLLSATDKIVLKYRTTEATPTELSITWNTTSAFTTSTNLTSYVGYEIEVIQGQGSGKCAHITTVALVGSVYLVTLDDTFAGITNGNTAKARMQNWTKLPKEITDQTDGWTELPIGKTSTRIQLKCCIISTGKNELFQIALINAPHKLAQ